MASPVLSSFWQRYFDSDTLSFSAGTHTVRGRCYALTPSLILFLPLSLSLSLSHFLSHSFACSLSAIWITSWLGLIITRTSWQAAVSIKVKLKPIPQLHVHLCTCIFVHIHVHRWCVLNKYFLCVHVQLVPIRHICIIINIYSPSLAPELNTTCKLELRIIVA